MKALLRRIHVNVQNSSILSTNSKVGATSQDSIIHSGCKGLTFCLLYSHATLSPKKKIHKLQISCAQMPNILLKPRANERNIVGCYMLRPFTQPVACCCAKFETGQTFSYVQTDATTPNIAGPKSWELLRPLPSSFAFLFSSLSSRNCLPFTCACAQSTTFSSC